MLSQSERDVEAHDDQDTRPALLRPILTSLVSLAGIGVAGYLTLAHYLTTISLVCPGGGQGRTIDCEKVTTSPQSYVFHIPVAVLGLCFFVPMFVLCLPWAWRSATRYLAPARLLFATFGMGFVCYLVYVELFEVHAICLWCTAVHALTFILFATIVTGWDDATRGAELAP